MKDLLDYLTKHYTQENYLYNGNVYLQINATNNQLEFITSKEIKENKEIDQDYLDDWKQINSSNIYIYEYNRRIMKS